MNREINHDNEKMKWNINRQIIYIFVCIEMYGKTSIETDNRSPANIFYS